MDIVERARSCNGALHSAVGATATEETWKQIAAYLEKLRPQVEALGQHLARSRVLEAAVSAPHLGRVRSALVQVQKAFDTEPDQLAQGAAAAALRAALTDAVKEHRTLLRDTWSRLRDGVLDDAPEGLLRLYAAVPDAREGAQKASTLRGRIASATTPPEEIKDLEAFKRAMEALRQLIEELRSVPLPPDVERFLDRALRGEARWAQLTPGVMDWLDKYDMLSNLRVKIV